MAKKATSKASSSAATQVMPFQAQLVRACLDMLVSTKVFHWQTYRHAKHEASDMFYDDLNDKVDSLIEQCMGVDGRFDMACGQTIRVPNMTFPKYLRKLLAFQQMLRGLEASGMSNKKYRGVLNTRDDLLGVIDQYLYRLTLV